LLVIYKIIQEVQLALMGDGSNNQMIVLLGHHAADLYLRLYHTFIFIDSPATTSATTYKTQYARRESILCDQVLIQRYNDTF
jgi:hypothetical protein